MTVIIIFATGYAVGGISALLLVGLTLVGRRARFGRQPLELMSYDIEHSAL